MHASWVPDLQNLMTSFVCVCVFFVVVVTLDGTNTIFGS